MENKRILWLFPLLTQLVLTLFLPFFNSFTLSNLGYIALFATLPAFYFALVCLRYKFHQRNLIQIAFWSGAINFLNTLIFFSILSAIEPLQTQISLWENTIAIIAYALMFALTAIMYSLVILRIFLPKNI
ncbi:hypothetical protein A6B43_01935 [Vespertiliibacter pulmonis]|uniref:Uncharacterized protein n=1 Tax=Vespertiliibacter pulmonis TaxID=1443036 RepID=A0A3N4WA09_9PAST|nr:hypothetical protein [Vespertiliibacter pulmonis]QLB20390.1 hypothetical protein A6B43_01935 [Vespertiliibacter pulmonis]RPE86377.1 hypothetical protein EDC46_0775 [Vespertiliibacter pulmonis]